MFRYLLVSSFLIYFSSCGHAQNDDQTFLKKVNQEINSGIDVSSILVNKTYLPIHSVTAFRELIRDHATATVLSIATADEPGKKIRVNGIITDKEGQPVAEALVYMYQTDAKGWYAGDAPHITQNNGDVGHARLFGYVKTDADGKFVLHTIKPSGYPNSDLPAHIHVHVTKSGYRNFVNEFLFDDDPRLQGEIRKMSIQNNFMISKPEKSTAPFEQQFTYTIRLDK